MKIVTQVLVKACPASRENVSCQTVIQAPSLQTAHSLVGMLDSGSERSPPHASTCNPTCNPTCPQEGPTGGPAAGVCRPTPEEYGEPELPLPPPHLSDTQMSQSLDTWSISHNAASTQAATGLTQAAQPAAPAPNLTDSAYVPPHASTCNPTCNPSWPQEGPTDGPAAGVCRPTPEEYGEPELPLPPPHLSDTQMSQSLDTWSVSHNAASTQAATGLTQAAQPAAPAPNQADSEHTPESMRLSYETVTSSGRYKHHIGPEPSATEGITSPSI